MSDHPYRDNHAPTDGSIDVRPLESRCFYCKRWHEVGDYLDVVLGDGTTCYAADRFEAAVDRLRGIGEDGE